MIEASVKMVKSVAGERRDIPHMHQASIDYIIKIELFNRKRNEAVYETIKK